MSEQPRNRNAYCSFCRKSYQDVGPLVEGPGDVYICGHCVDLCQQIIGQEMKRRSEVPGFVAEFQDLCTASQIEVLVRLAHELTILARNPYWLPSINEIQHRITAQLSTLLMSSPKCHSDEELVSIILRQGTPPDLRVSIAEAFRRSLIPDTPNQTVPTSIAPPAD